MMIVCRAERIFRVIDLGKVMDWGSAAFRGTARRLCGEPHLLLDSQRINVFIWR